MSVRRIQRNGDRETELELFVSVPTFGKPDQDMKTAEGILRTLRVSLHSRVEADLVTDDGDVVPVQYSEATGQDYEL